MPKKLSLTVDIWQCYRALDLDTPIGKDVAQFGTAVAQHLSYQESSMALLWLSAAAE